MPELASEADFELGRAALLEITSAESVGAPAGSVDEGDGVTTLYFETTLPGYPGWRWTVSIAHVDGEQATAMETELTPGDGALLSPDWVPWADRLADYRATQEAADLEAVESESDLDGDDDDDQDDDNDVLHGGDLDGVDIDLADDDDQDDDLDGDLDEGDLDDSELDDSDLDDDGADSAPTRPDDGVDEAERPEH